MVLMEQVNTAGGPHASKVVGIGALRSYEHMGTAGITCISGCNCPESILEGTHSAHTSVEVWHHLAVGSLCTGHNLKAEDSEQGKGLSGSWSASRAAAKVPNAPHAAITALQILGL